MAATRNNEKNMRLRAPPFSAVRPAASSSPSAPTAHSVLNLVDVVGPAYWTLVHPDGARHRASPRAPGVARPRQARDQKGDERKAFTSECLKAKPHRAAIC